MFFLEHKDYRKIALTRNSLSPQDEGQLSTLPVPKELPVICQEA